MHEILTFKTNYIDDCIKIWKENKSFTKLFKSSWVGSTVEYQLDDKIYRISRSGLFFPKIKIVEKNNYLEIANTRVDVPYFGINYTARTKFNDGKCFDWHQKGIVNCNWTWQDNNEIVVQTIEKNKIFSISGEIVLTNENTYNYLLTILGLYLRTSIVRQHRAFFMAAIIFFMYAIIQRFCL